MFKKIFYFVVVLFVIYFALCIAGPKKFSASVTRKINSPVEVVFPLVADFKNWPIWSSWLKEDSSAKITFGNQTTGLGGSYAWKSPKSGDGTMKITEYEENKSFTSDLIFVGMEEMPNQMSMQCEPIGNQTQITWTMASKNDVPFMQRGIMLIMGLFYDVRNDFNKGLNNLETYIKSGKAGITLNGIQIKETQVDAKQYIGVRKVVPFSKIGEQFAEYFPSIAKVAGNNIQGVPSGLYFRWDEKKQETDMMVAFSVNSSQQATPPYQIYQLNQSKAYTADYYGPYEKTQLTYQALDSAIKIKGYQHPELVLEEYITDPILEKDTSKWLTRIYFIVK